MTQDIQATLESQYKEILELLNQGYSKEEIEKRFGISLNNLDLNSEQYPKFVAGAEQMVNKHIGITRGAIWKLAVGYEYEEKTVTERVLPNGEVEKTTTVVTRMKHPDLEACKEIIRMINDTPYFGEGVGKHPSESSSASQVTSQYASTRYTAPTPKTSAC